MKRGGVVISLLAMGMVSAIGCEDDPGIRGEPIRIGLIVSLSGGLAPVGPHLVDSAELAVREVNAAGGLLGGRRVELIVRDDRTDAAQAAIEARDLLDQGVVAIIGSLGSSASLAVQEVTFPAQIPQISCCSTSPDLTEVQPETDRYFFRTVPSDLLQSVVVARYAQTRACTRLAILHQNDSYGDPFGRGIEDQFTALGGNVVLRQAFSDGRPSYVTEVTAIAEATPDCVALVAFTVDGGMILSDWAGLATRPDVTWIGTDGIKDAGLIEAAGSPAVVDGVVGTAPITDPGTRFSNAYAASYEATYAAQIGIFGGNQYDATASMLLAIEAAGSTEGSAIRDALYRVTNPDDDDIVVGPGDLGTALQSIRSGNRIDYEGASGPVNIDSMGNTLSNYEIWQYDAAMDEFIRIDEIQASEIQ